MILIAIIQSTIAIFYFNALSKNTRNNLNKVLIKVIFQLVLLFSHSQRVLKKRSRSIESKDI